jgi:hypothetical protein
MEDIMWIRGKSKKACGSSEISDTEAYLEPRRTAAASLDVKKFPCLTISV